MIHSKQIDSEGFSIINNVFTENEIENLISLIDNKTKNDSDNSTFRKSEDLFAIRQFHKEVPETLPFIFNEKLQNIIESIFGKGFFITKSIYFDKPEKSNWFVAYHQDLTISVDQKIEIENFENWTVKQNQFAVQPPTEILENNFTIRIHIDKTTKNNGALKVINNSHSKGILRIENLDFEKEKETICEVEKGGIMIMKPLLFHASNKTTNNERRRVIHIEFSKQQLPNGLEWSEKTILN
ncbi:MULTISPECIES: phytanoyl-CoA dioxygenase family protein [Flavobacterium]|jgi:ectoine hydroxylase-related dioxygenase (phytanoyl-CoA dioxygenase family)|uniref:Phytanoyl-CoA dioxygenase (PhyH) n=1 Tax=Flavobacterium anhuiense TaxID=459526 RepID=A0ABY0M3P4_9FLAO|nr:MULTISPECIES: phytanoyl-CoA dioxygenase family protein [Flavobacterium]EJG00418.1 phytanoyl-CoA dioxygenase [Flavobacterium sp. F52]URM38546.1 phytanoyl-CoA dioxygenase family protein [Flavobacterium anhuiense]SCY97858.1 Phytanoyl-CoA dioxygenase (PhyH) [Flavobacterium anhuiense]